MSCFNNFLSGHFSLLVSWRKEKDAHIFLHIGSKGDGEQGILNEKWSKGKGPSSSFST